MIGKTIIKVLIGKTPSGAYHLYHRHMKGPISDRQLFKVSGMLEKLDPGDEIMADKGFFIQDLLIAQGI